MCRVVKEQATFNDLEYSGTQSAYLFLTPELYLQKMESQSSGLGSQKRL
jgi:hypothetical protein